MSFEPFDWNVVIVGRWNTSILTPARIGEKIFKLESNEGLAVEVPLDGLSPYRIMDPERKVRVTPESNRLIVQLIKMDYTTIGSALEIGRDILDWLPETPLSAAGFNIRFKTSESIPHLISMLDSDVDKRIPNIGDIVNRSITRSVEYKPGKINIIINYDNDTYKVLFNFHCSCKNSEEAKTWLNQTPEKIEEQVTILREKLGVADEEAKNDKPN